MEDVIGWHISVFRQPDGGASPAGIDSAPGARVAVWQGGWEGLRWIDELVKAGAAVALGGNGYPYYYTAQAAHLIPPILDGPPDARGTWVYGQYDVVTDQWEGKTTIDRAAVDDCRPDEWLLFEAWDES